VVNDTTDRIVLPVFPGGVERDAQENFGVSQDVVRSPDEVSLIKNLQIWTFDPVRDSEHLYE
jgi:hypothetical protein